VLSSGYRNEDADAFTASGAVPSVRDWSQRRAERGIIHGGRFQRRTSPKSPKTKIEQIVADQKAGFLAKT
jgi:hypothetical protein